MDSFIFIDKHQLKLDPKVKVIKADSYSRIIAAEDALTQARKLADQIVEDAKSKADDILKSAEKTYVEEKKRGYREGMQIAKHEMATKMGTMALKSTQFFHNIEEQVVTLVIDTVRKVVDTIDQDELITRLVKKALAVFKNRKAIILKVAPVQVDTLNEHLSEILQSYPYVETIEVNGDDRLVPGQVIMESSLGIVDAGIETQLSAIRQAFIKSFKETTE
jgi:type III secretion protein L